MFSSLYFSLFFNTLLFSFSFSSFCWLSLHCFWRYLFSFSFSFNFCSNFYNLSSKVFFCMSLSVSSLFVFVKLSWSYLIEFYNFFFSLIKSFLEFSKSLLTLFSWIQTLSSYCSFFESYDWRFYTYLSNCSNCCCISLSFILLFDDSSFKEWIVYCEVDNWVETPSN